MRISDLSSDVCSSDLRIARVVAQGGDLSVLDEDFADWARLETTLGGRDIDRIVHLGSQAGVRYSLVNPHAYARTNLTGHLNLLEIARARGVAHMENGRASWRERVCQYV